MFGEVVGIVLKSVPASEQLRNEANFQYDRQRWLSVRDQKGLIAVVKPILMSSAVVVSSSVYSTSQTSATIGEKVSVK